MRKAYGRQNKITMTENHKTNAEADIRTYMFSSSQLLDYDEGHPEDNDRPGQTPSRAVVDSEGFSYEMENMKVQLLGHYAIAMEQN